MDREKIDNLYNFVYQYQDMGFRVILSNCFGYDNGATILYPLSRYEDLKGSEDDLDGDDQRFITDYEQLVEKVIYFFESHYYTLKNLSEYPIHDKNDSHIIAYLDKNRDARVLICCGILKSNDSRNELLFLKDNLKGGFGQELKFDIQEIDGYDTIIIKVD